MPAAYAHIGLPVPTAPTNASTTAPTSFVTMAPLTTSAPVPTPPPTATTVVSDAPTTTLLRELPEPSFALSVERVGDRLVFRWPQFTGPLGRGYVLVHLQANDRPQWPPAQLTIARAITGLDQNFTTVALPANEARRWVLAVIGEDRHLLALSAVATST